MSNFFLRTIAPFFLKSSIPFILIGILISLFHYSIQVFPLEESCEIINCSSPYVWELGFISIPLMAFFNFFGLLLIIIKICKI